VVKPEFESFADPIFDEKGMLSAKLNSKWGFINKKGKWLIPPVFDAVADFFDDDDLCAAKFNGEWGFINRKGEWIIFPQYEALFCDWPHLLDNYGTVAVKYKGKWGWIDHEDNWIIKPIFDDVQGYFEENGLCPATFNGEKGTVNREGKWRKENK